MLPVYELRQLAKKHLEDFRNVKKTMKDDVKKSLGAWPDRLEDVLVKMATEPIPYHRDRVETYANKCSELAEACEYTDDTKAIRNFCANCRAAFQDVKIPDKWANMPTKDKNLFKEEYSQEDAKAKEFCAESRKLVNMKLRIDTPDLDPGAKKIIKSLEDQLRYELASLDVYKECVENVTSRADEPAETSKMMRRILDNATIKGILLNEQSNSPSYGPVEQMIMNGKISNFYVLAQLVRNTAEVIKLYDDASVGDMYGFIAYQGYRDTANQIIPKMYKALQQTAKEQKMNPNPKLQKSSRAAEVNIVAPPKKAELKKPDASKGKNVPKA